MLQKGNLISTNLFLKASINFKNQNVLSFKDVIIKAYH